MTEQTIISKRIAELEAENEGLGAKIAKNNAELEELAAAARVIARLTSSVASRSNPASNPSDVDDQEKPKSSPKPRDIPSMPEMIIESLRASNTPLEPKEITEHIRHRWWPDADGQKIGSVVWRLNNRQDIEKVEGTSTYRLPQKEEAPDENPGRNTSEASLFTVDPEVQGVKATPGGGP